MATTPPTSPPDLPVLDQQTPLPLQLPVLPGSSHQPLETPADTVCVEKGLKKS